MLFAIVLLVLLAPAASGADDLSRFLGKWRGDSSCVARNTACHDETVVYRLSDLPNKPGYVLVSADKIVNGNAINMGTLEFRYHQTQQMLVCEYSQGVWQLKLTGERMEGRLTLQDGTEFRRVTLQRER
jgi:hypothetical protein